MKNYNTLLCAGLAFASVSQVVAYPLQELARSVSSKTSISIPFQQKPRMPKSSLRKRQDTNPNDDQTILGNENDVRYIASIVIAGEPLDVVIDSGSTDTFVFSVQPDGLQNIPTSELPPLFNNATAQNVIDTGLTYNASYGGGNGITSTLGAIQLAPVSINGTDLQANNLTYANLYSSSSPTGASGLLGLGFPFNGAIYLTILEAFEAANQPLTSDETQRFFPLVPLLEYQGKIDQALFSIVVDRLDSTAPLTADNQFDTVFSNGTLTFGGYPQGYQQSDFVFSSVPVVQFNERGQSIGLPSSTGNRWTLPLEAIYFNGQQLTNTTAQTDYYTDGEIYYALIDTGNPSMSFPQDIMDQIIPSGAWAGNPNNRVIDCNTQFDLTLQFAGQQFPLSTQDLLVPSYLAVDSLGYGGFAQDQCQFQAQPDPPTPDEIGPGTSITYQLGDPFLRNVAAVFNYGNILNSLQTPPTIGLAARK